MKISKADLMGIVNNLRQIKAEKTDIFFFIYTGISVPLRIYLTQELLKHFDIIITVGITFLYSSVITFIAIKISDLLKLDWYAKEKENIIFLIIDFLFKEISKNSLLKILFIFDPFLFYIYYRNGSRKTRKVWLLLLISLLFVSCFWGILGYLINWKVIAIAIITLLLATKKATKILLKSYVNKT